MGYTLLGLLIVLCLLGSIIAGIIGKRITGKPYYEYSGFNVVMLGVMVLGYFLITSFLISFGMGIILLPLIFIGYDITYIILVTIALPVSVLVCLYNVKEISKKTWYKITTTILLLLFVQMCSLVVYLPWFS